MKIHNLILAFKDQLPLRRMWRNYVITRRGWGIFHRNSHISQRSGVPKIAYGSIKSADKAAASMQKKYGGTYRRYKCVFCDGYHIGKNRD